ncbi:histidine kinase [Flavobacterium sp. J27]|uniref:sensor histidine kinase n=1 Tax=Flavobacterium sp. J27 TaxID=2060419 RepID=UPI0010305B36|nr:histidine kinase [Flavobacterium sp. J27]
MKTHLLYYFFLLLLVNILFAQDPIALKLTEKEGLPDVEFYDIIEDSTGFIWLAADKGLYRFDGKEYVQFSHSKKRGLSVFGLKFDPKKQLWCNTISGQFFYIKNEKLELFLDLKNELKGELAEFFFLDEALFIFSNSVLISVNLLTKERKEIKLPVTFKYPVIRAPFLVNNKIYFTANDFIFSVSKTNSVEKISQKLPVFGNNFFPKFFRFQKKEYLLIYDIISNKNLFFEIKENTLIATFFPKELQNTRIIKILNYYDELWFCTSNGLILADKNEDVITTKDIFFKNDFITNAILDENKTLWLTTLTNGVFIVPSLQIKRYENLVTNEVISATAKINENEVAIGTTKGNLFLLNLKTGEKENIFLNNKRKITALLFLPQQNEVLISTENFSFLYSFDSKRLTSLNCIFNAKDLHQVNNSNQIIYTGYDRATVFEYKNNTLAEIKRLNNNRAYNCFFNNDTHETYVSFVDNLLVYDASFNPTVLKYKNQSIIARSISKTADGTVWVATFTNGILGFKNHQIVGKIDEENGLKSNVIHEIKGDGSSLWIVTDQGIQVFNTTKNSFKSTLINAANFVGNIRDIIVNKESLYFVSQEGIFEIEKMIKSKAYYPKEVYVKSIMINEKDTLIQDHYELPYEKNRIKIAFHNNGYFPKEELQFSYRLIGLQEQWIPIEKNVNFVSFNSLPPKAYTFEVKAENSNGKSFISKKINFQINLPYWKRWWFVLPIFLSVFGIIILFYRNKLAIKEKENELVLKNTRFESELAVLKLENLKSQMNPHFIFNALNSIQEYIVLNQKHLASSYLAKFADLIRAYLNHSSKGYLSLKEEIECLNIYLELEKLRFEEKFSYKIINLVSKDEVKIPTMLIQPYVENAIKHGLLHKKGDRFLKILFEILADNQMLKCIIEDNGIGREKAAQLQRKRHQSFATQANKNRLELLNFGKEKKIGVTIEDVKNENNEVIGTKVILIIPILK